jgi:hypothetical protein
MLGEWWIVKDVEGSGRGLILMHYPGICLEGQSTTTTILNEDNQSRQDLNPELPEYDAGVLATRPRRLVFWDNVSVLFKLR